MKSHMTVLQYGGWKAVADSVRNLIAFGCYGIIFKNGINYLIGLLSAKVVPHDHRDVGKVIPRQTV